jgi:hypothetical protein
MSEETSTPKPEDKPQDEATGGFCSSCGTAIEPGSVFCKSCGTPVAGASGAAASQAVPTPVQVTVIQKRSGCWKVGGIGCGGLIALIVIIIIVVAVTNKNTPAAKGASGTIGSTLHVADNLNATLTGVTISHGNVVEKPRSGDEFAITHWKFHNFRSSDTDVADTSFKIESGGVIGNPNDVTSLSTNLVPVAGTTLAPDANFRGDMVFEIQKGKVATVTYSPNGPNYVWRFRG